MAAPRAVSAAISTDTMMRMILTFGFIFLVPFVNIIGVPGNLLIVGERRKRNNFTSYEVAKSLISDSDDKSSIKKRTRQKSGLAELRTLYFSQSWVKSYPQYCEKCSASERESQNSPSAFFLIHNCGREHLPCLVIQPYKRIFSPFSPTSQWMALSRRAVSCANVIASFFISRR